MRRVSFKKVWIMLSAVFLLALAPAVISSAASRPAAVTSVTAVDVKGKKATLTWEKVPDATGYNVYRADPKTGKITKLLKRTTKLKCKVTVKPGTAYSFRIYAYIQDGDKILESKKSSPLVDIQIPVLRQLCYGTGSAFLEWTQVKGASGYYLYKYDKSKKKYKKIKTIKNADTTSYRVSIPVGTTYKYMVRSYKNGMGIIQESNVLSVKGQKVESVHGRWWEAQLIRTVNVKDSETGKKLKLSKGMTVSASSKAWPDVTIFLPSISGDKPYVTQSDNLSFGELTLGPKYDYYNVNQSEYYVNSKKYSSKTNYLIWISQYTSSVHFFKGTKGHWKQQRVAQVILGDARGYTRTGQYELLWSDSTHTYFYWDEKMNWGQSFHGWVDSNRWGYFSSGCVRMSPSDLAYLRSLPMGTRVVSY